MFCTKCGTQNPDNSQFCEKCGATLADAPAQQPAQPTYQQPPVMPQQPAWPQNPTQKPAWLQPNSQMNIFIILAFVVAGLSFLSFIISLGFLGGISFVFFFTAAISLIVAFALMKIDNYLK